MEGYRASSFQIWPMRKFFGFTIVEILVVLIILAILTAIAVSGYSGFKEYGLEKDAKIKLKLIYSAQENFYGYKNTYTSDWNALDIEKPDNANYVFEIISADNSSFEARATRAGSAMGFKIDQSGSVVRF